MKSIPVSKVIRVLAGTLLQDETRENAVEIICVIQEFSEGTVPFMTKPGSHARRAKMIIQTLKNLGIRDVSKFIKEARKIYLRERRVLDMFN